MPISHAKGCYIYDKNNKAYLDFVAGVSVNTLGHGHPKIIKAIKQQLDAYMHVMVYGEYVLEPAVNLTKLLAKHLPKPLQTTYLTNSGTEAVEGAIKLAKRITGRSQIIAAKKAYHGNTIGALSIMGFEARKQAFRPLMTDVKFIEYNDISNLKMITSKTAAVVLETIQGSAGFITPHPDYMAAVQSQCNAVGALFILDEIQTGIGRTGKLFGFEHYHCTPDIIVCGKGLGGGLPIGAFIASQEHMATLKDNPELGHITTFGGHPVIASAALATLTEIVSTNIMDAVLTKEKLIKKHLKHPHILQIRGKGLMLSAIVKNANMANTVIKRCQEKGLILFWLLFEPRAIRITPPLNITENEIIKACNIIKNVLNELPK